MRAARSISTIEDLLAILKPRELVRAGNISGRSYHARIQYLERLQATITDELVPHWAIIDALIAAKPQDSATAFLVSAFGHKVLYMMLIKLRAVMYYLRVVKLNLRSSVDYDDVD